ncbi:MAG: serine hydrolase [Chryseobacterium sp.]|nr:MAG: serine hydrolase [Chryseobacterium sp.]
MKYILIAIFFMFGIGTVYSQNSKKIDELLSTYESINQFNGSVLIAKKGKIIFEKSYGYRNAEKGEKNTNNSQYKIFSTTKMFTATVILKLVEQGKLSLDDKLSKYYSNFPNGDSITLKNMLSHTSGIPETDDSENTKNEETFLKYIIQKKMDFLPGKSWGYSNSNYYLLGYIIKKVTGLEYDKAIEEFILKPLKMSASGFHFNELKSENKAVGYEFIDGKNSNRALLFKTDHPFAAGAMYSTVEDLYKFGEALYGGKIISKQMLETMYTPYLNDHYGLAQEIYKTPNSDIVQVGHGGGGPGYKCRFVRDLKNDITIIILINSEMISGKAADNLTDIIYNRPYTTISKTKINRIDLQKLQGIYSFESENYYINVINETMVFNGGGIPRMPLTPISKTDYKLFENFDLRFNADDTVTITNAQGSKTIKKMSDVFPWGIIGTATPSGWDGKDIVLETQKSNPDFYYLKNYKLKAGDLRFRLNNDWANSLGLNSDDESICYDGYNILIKEDGLYDIVLDMSIKSKPQYSIKKVN